MSEEQKQILKMVESGRITAEEGATLLGMVSESEVTDSNWMQQEKTPSAAKEQDEGEHGWPHTRPYWLYPLSGGLLLLLVGGAVVTTMYQQSRVGVWTWLFGWIPLFLGLFVVTVAAWARTAHWIHLRVIGRHERIVLSFPLPLGLSAFVISIARRFIPKLRETSIDEVILALRDGLSNGQPIMIEVQDEVEGEHVQIHIR